MDPKAHWDAVYQTKGPTGVSWFQRTPSISLDLIRRIAPAPASALVDVGGGASTLVDGLVAAGYSNVAVLDISAAALEQAQRRLGPAADAITWREGDLLDVDFEPRSIDLWHDRAVFHFLTSASDRARYVEQVRRAVKPGGHVLVATFAEDGPTSCSGLPVRRYDREGLHAEFDGGFRLLESVREQHVTPSGQTQSFVYCVCQFVGLDKHAAA